ncbi:MAG: hypothetical protein QXS93_02825 [Candidatus Micrarchaeia archaeon]
MTRSMKTHELKMVSANSASGNEFDTLKDVVATKRNESWVRKVPRVMRNAFYGIAIATMLFLSSEARAQDIPDIPGEPSVPVSQQPQQKQEMPEAPSAPIVSEAQPPEQKVQESAPSVSLSEDLKSAYVSYKRGKISESDLGVLLAREAARIVKEQNLEPKKFAEVLSNLKKQLESWCNCNDECSGAPQKKAVTANKKSGKSKGSSVIKKDGKKRKANVSVEEVSKEKYERNICDLAGKEGVPLEGCGENAGKNEPQVVIIKRTAEPKKAGVDKEPISTESTNEPNEEGAKVIDANMVDTANDNSGKNESPLTSNESVNNVPQSQYFELSIPMSGGYSNVLSPYRGNNYLKSIRGSTPVVMGALLGNPHFGLSVMGGYNGNYYLFNSFDSTVYTRHSSLAGAGILLRFDNTSLHALLTMNGSFEQENMGLLLLTNNPVFNLSLATQFWSETPTEFALRYWNPNSQYPLIFESSGLLKEAQDTSIGAKYRISDWDAWLQIPLAYGSDSGVYPNLVLGGKYYKMNANPNDREIIAGKVGGSITYKWLNVGAVYIPAYASYTRFLFGEDGTYVDKNGVEHTGQLWETIKYISGAGLFVNAKMLSGDNDSWYLVTHLDYEKIGTNYWVNGLFTLNLRW